MDQKNLFSFTQQEKETLKTALSTVQYDPAGGAEYITKLKRAVVPALPERVLHALYEQKASLNPAPYLIFDNLPLDEIIYYNPDPMVYDKDAKSGCISENLMVAFASMLGESYGVPFDGEDLVTSLIPTNKNRTTFTAFGSEADLDFHIEHAALKFIKDANVAPLGLLLTGVNFDENGPFTRLSDARAALALLSDEDIKILKSPLFEMNVPYLWRSAFPEGKNKNTSCTYSKRRH